MEKKNNKKRNVLIALAAVAVVCVFLFSSCVGALLRAGNASYEEVPEKSFAIIDIAGTIQASPDSPVDSSGYNHANLMDCVDSLMEDESNYGILLKVNSGGGTVYHSDEFYLKLMEYKEVTGRPIHAYFEQTAASGAYYISCAADYISANRNCWTGSIGVIISYTNMQGLYEKLGLEEIVISTGANKAMGSVAGTLTDEQYAIYQSLVDESYDVFVDIVARGRNMDIEKVRQIADGRIYSAQQAFENGLIDKVEGWEDALLAMEEKTGAEGWHVHFETSATLLDYLLYKISDVMPKSDMDIINGMVTSELSGVPLYMMVN